MLTRSAIEVLTLIPDRKSESLSPVPLQTVLPCDPAARPDTMHLYVLAAALRRARRLMQTRLPCLSTRRRRLTRTPGNRPHSPP